MFSLLLKNFLGVFLGRQDSQKTKLILLTFQKKKFALQITLSVQPYSKAFLTKLQQLETESKACHTDWYSALLSYKAGTAPRRTNHKRSFGKQQNSRKSFWERSTVLLWYFGGWKEGKAIPYKAPSSSKTPRIRVLVFFWLSFYVCHYWCFS